MGAIDAILKALLPTSMAIDSANRWIGRLIAWALLLAVVVSTANAVVRKVLDTSSNSWLELQWILFSMVFMLCSPWTLLSNEHIRIDIVNNLMPKWLRNTIDSVGHAFFLLPLCAVMVVTGVPFFKESWLTNEQSMNAGGLPQWPTKALVAVGFALLFAQGISELIKRLSIMRGLIPDPHENQRDAIAEEVEHIVDAIEHR